MGWLQGVAVMVLMLFLRLAVPVAITFAVGYALHRLDVRWHSETASMVGSDNRQTAPEAQLYSS